MPTRDRRSASRRSARPTTSSVTPRSARSTTRSASTVLRPAASAGPGGGTFRVEDMGDLGDLFGGLFGGGGGAGGADPARAPARRRHGGRAAPLLRGRRARGDHLGQRARATSAARTAAAPGAAPGTSTHTCPRCGGTGSLNDNQGLFSLSTVCPECIGRGTLFDTPCPICAGTGTEQKVRTVKVRIPAGVEGGQRIRVKGRGAPGQGMAPPGDLYVVVHVSQAPGVRPQRAQPDPHRADHLPRGGARDHAHRAHARRYGDPAGATRDPVGPHVPGPRPGRPGRRGRNGAKPGDLLVKVEVQVPTELTEEQRAAVESLAAVTEPPPRVGELERGDAQPRRSAATPTRPST